ncbi:urease accessory protein ureD-like protein [Phlyctema vagabunda]|uniref:Urease accessory protein ureD-like protein n=1 Tax=Phlyctema vagabunda TaxID=108571 RepID=A0ABR4PKY7_9HELO
MISPFPPSSSAPGEGRLVVQRLPHAVSALSTMTFQYPLKLISPSPTTHQKSLLVFLLTYGGGLVGGDKVHLVVEVQADARLSVATQGHTKIFKSPSLDVVTQQALHVNVLPGAALCLLPDPVQPFAGSVYEQYQKVTLQHGASLCLLDWVSAGRSARGENWEFRRWSSRNEVWTSVPGEPRPRMLLRDNVQLQADPEADELLKKKMQGLEVFGTLFLHGPMTERLAAFFLAEFGTLPRIGARDFRSPATVDRDDRKPLSRRESWRRARREQEDRDAVHWSAAKVRGCAVVKFAARSVEGSRTWIASMLAEEGSISAQFGEEALICLS